MKRFAIIAVAVAVALATAASPFASASPDGLEKVAADKAFLDRGATQETSALDDYAIPGVADERLATGLAGFGGTLLVFAAGYGLARVVVRRPPRSRSAR
jgi:PDGLE domain-containing protein